MEDKKSATAVLRGDPVRPDTFVALASSRPVAGVERSALSGGAIQILPGQYLDKETGLFYNYFRDYDPQTGRYLQPDPFLTVNRLVTRDWVFPVPYLLDRPQTLHPYTYVANGPLANADPLGLIWPIDCYECFFSNRNKFEQSLKECRNEFNRCKDEKEQRGGPIRLDSARGLDKWILCG